MDRGGWGSGDYSERSKGQRWVRGGAGNKGVKGVRVQMNKRDIRGLGDRGAGANEQKGE